MTSRTILHEVRRLRQTIRKLSANQATLKFPADSDRIDRVEIEIRPSSGYYHGGTFIFRIAVGDNFPTEPPTVLCNTPIHHPNIDVTDDTIGGFPVCLSILRGDEWSSKNDLCDVVQGLLYLLYNPNREDPINFYFFREMTDGEFAESIKKSLLGADFVYYNFEKNYKIFNNSTAHLGMKSCYELQRQNRSESNTVHSPEEGTMKNTESKPFNISKSNSSPQSITNNVLETTTKYGKPCASKNSQKYITEFSIYSNPESCLRRCRCWWTINSRGYHSLSCQFFGEGKKVSSIPDIP